MLVGLLAGCGSTKHPDAVPASTTTTTSAKPPQPDPTLPAGWKRFTFGVMSVGAPRTWTVDRAALPVCGHPPADTVTEASVSEIESASCPSISPNQPAVESVSIECLVGQAAAEFPSTSATTARDGLVHEEYDVYRRVGKAVGLVSFPAFGTTAAIGQQILATARPASGTC